MRIDNKFHPVYHWACDYLSMLRLQLNHRPQVGKNQPRANGRTYWSPYHKWVLWLWATSLLHYIHVIMGDMASQITSLTIVCSTVYSGADQRKHQSSASLSFVRGIHRWPVNSLHKWPVTRKMFPFDDVIMCNKLMSNRHQATHQQTWRCCCYDGSIEHQGPIY